jgi:CubicO group peptidase (beta-lactamase class C family)
MWGFLFFSSLLLVVACDNSAPKTERVIKPEKPTPNFTKFSNTTEQRFVHYFDSLGKRGGFNGVLLANRADSLFKHKYGSPKLGIKDSFSFDDVFQLASVSKPITAFGFLRLLEQREIEIHTPIKEILPLFSDKRVTFYQLLTHTSGLGNYIYMTDSLWSNPDSMISNSEIRCYFEEDLIPAYHTPGKTFDYCNSNFVLIAVLIEEISGQPFRQYMNENVFGPLSMINTHFIDPKEKSCIEYEVDGHYPNGEKKYPFYLNGAIGDKGLYSSVNDLFKFYQELQNPTLLSDSLLLLSMKSHVKTGHASFYGLGWRSKTLGTDNLVFHNGWWRGFRTYFWFNHDRSKCFIALTNSIRGGYLKQEGIWNLF